MLRLILAPFRFLMPKEEPFIERFVAHAGKVCDAAEVFRAVVRGGDGAEERFDALCRIEREADDIATATIDAVHRTFITPFDGSQIEKLVEGMDDTVDVMRETARRLTIRGAVACPDEVVAMADEIVACAAALAEIVPLLDSISRDADRIKGGCKRIKAIKKAVNDLRDRRLAAVWRGANDLSPGQRFVEENTCDNVVLVADKFKDVAKTISQIVTEQA